MESVQAIKQRFGIIGNSALLNRAIDVAMQVAPTEISVLINGENRLIEGSEKYEALPVWDSWGVDIHRHIGSMLLEIILEHVTFEGNPVFNLVLVALKYATTEVNKELDEFAVVPATVVFH